MGVVLIYSISSFSFDILDEAVVAAAAHIVVTTREANFPR